MGRLVKRVEMSLTPGSPGVPADPGQPYLPARDVLGWYQEGATVYVAGAYVTNMSYHNRARYGGYAKTVMDGVIYESARRYGPITTFFDFRQSLTPDVQAYGYGQNQIKVGSGFKRIFVYDVPTLYRAPEQKYIPPTETKAPVAAQINKMYNPGWNASGRSIKMLLGPGEATFTVPVVNGVVVGFARSEDPLGYEQVEQGLYFTDGTIKVVENGVVGQGLGISTHETSVTLTRHLDGSVTVALDSPSLTAAHTYSTPSNGPVFLYAVLYYGGDSVGEPLITPVETGTIEVEVFGGGFEGEDYSAGYLHIPEVLATGYEPGIPPTLNPLEVYGWESEYSEATVHIAEPHGYAPAVEMTPATPTTGGIVLNFITVVGTSLSGSVIDDGFELDAFLIMGYDDDYAEILDFALNPLEVSGEDDDQSTGDLIEIGTASTQLKALSELIATLLVQAQHVVTVDAQKISAEQIDAKAQATLTFQALGEILAELLAYAAGITPLPEPEAESFAWATTEQGGMVTRYSGYNFQSFAEINGRYYGVRTDGVFLLEGVQDDEVPITAEVNLGGTNFGGAELKHLPCVYTGVRVTDGALFLKVETSQGDFTYQARRTTERMATQRFDLGRGLRDNWFDFTLIAEDVAEFELDNVEFNPVTSKRRI